MVLLEDYKVIFLKNPKCAGTSIEICFKDINFFPFNQNKSIDNRVIDIRRNICVDIEKIEYSNNYYGNIETYPYFYERYINLNDIVKVDGIPGGVDNYTTYAIIRDPVDRFISICKYMRDQGGVVRFHLFKERLAAVSTKTDLLFPSEGFKITDPKIFEKFSPEFRKCYEGISIDELANTILDLKTTPDFNIDLMRIPQGYYYNDPRVTVLDFAKLEDQFTNTLKKHNIPLKYSLPKTNISFNKDSAKKVLKPETIEKIRYAYAEDVEFYENMTKNA